MNTVEKSEASIIKTNNILVALSKLEDDNLFQDFCGSAIAVDDISLNIPNFSEKTVYLCGNISQARSLELDLMAAERVFVIRELSHNYDENEYSKTLSVIGVGRVPILIHGVGVYYQRFFDLDYDYFNLIRGEHVFQSLTESTKPGKAHRTGIYLTPVEQKNDDLHFRLLRCSTNLSGSTENFRANDRHIVDALNQEAASIFQNQATLNHVLAQIYHNTPATIEQKQTKAKINTHADKTKDMPKNGIMAFCTFYDQLDRLQPLIKNSFDYGYKGISGMTRLVFRLKRSVAERPECNLPAKFTVTLYPNSVFFMPLSTNRLYTHEIRSSSLDAEKLPTRLGYVVRCSSSEAVYKRDRTFLKMDGELIELESPTAEGITELRKFYAEENKTDTFIDYEDKFLFSMNNGDYLPPKYRMADEFYQYNLSVESNLFEKLSKSSRFEDQGKGRQGTVLLNPHEKRGIPIVRTTSKYNASAQCFGTLHTSLAKEIQKRASIAMDFNNALIENYTNAYTKMGFHSDQALDLEDESYIAIFSCYKYPELVNSQRKLVIEPKESSGDRFEISLVHNSVVVFSLNANRRFKHKIVLDSSAHLSENQWLGITFRRSKTFVQFRGDKVYFEDGTALTLASEKRQGEFYSLRHCENKETNFIYPRITYTISESDMILPVFV